MLIHFICVCAEEVGDNSTTASIDTILQLARIGCDSGAAVVLSGMGGQQPTGQDPIWVNQQIASVWSHIQQVRDFFSHHTYIFFSIR